MLSINKVCHRGWWSISFRVSIRSFLCDHIELQAAGCFLHRRNSLMWLSWTKPSFSSIAGNALACFLDQLQWHFNPYFTSWGQKKKEGLVQVICTRGKNKKRENLQMTRFDTWWIQIKPKKKHVRYDFEFSCSLLIILVYMIIN